MKIRAAITRVPSEEFLIEEVSLEAPRSDEVLVKIVGVGICHSDIAVRNQDIPFKLPAVLGHEGSGIVEKVGDNVDDLVPGDHVVLSFMSCGKCFNCTDGLPAYCPEFPSLNLVDARRDGTSPLSNETDGKLSHFFGQSSFATYAIAHRQNTIKVRKDAPLEFLGPLGCGFLTGAGSIMRALKCEVDSSLAILGGGSVGLSALMGAVAQQCNPIIVVEPQESRRVLALELGATHVIDPFSCEDLTAELREIAPLGLHYVFDNTSVPSVMTSGLHALRAKGTLMISGIPNPSAPALSLDIFPMLLQGWRVMATTEGDADPAEFIPVMVDMFMDGNFPLDKVLSFYSLEEINEAIEAHYKGEILKVVLKP